MINELANCNNLNNAKPNRYQWEHLMKNMNVYNLKAFTSNFSSTRKITYKTCDTKLLFQ